MKQIHSGQRWNESFIDFANYYGFSPKRCRPYRPRTKGKVERAISYIRSSFLAGRSFNDLPDINAQGYHWMNHVANTRIHATTEKRPIDLLSHERTDQRLNDFKTLPPYQILVPAKRLVHNDCFVRFEGSRYSVPPKYCGKTVIITHHQQQVVIRCHDLIIAEHPLAQHKGSSIANNDHIDQLWKLSVQSSPERQKSQPILTFDQHVDSCPLSVFEEVA